jgi:hypothetical protein
MLLQQAVAYCIGLRSGCWGRYFTREQRNLLPHVPSSCAISLASFLFPILLGVGFERNFPAGLPQLAPNCPVDKAEHPCALHRPRLGGGVDGKWRRGSFVGSIGPRLRASVRG